MLIRIDEKVKQLNSKNPNVKIPEETRQRVLQAMEDLGYVPNILARGLRSGQTKTVGLVVPDNSNPFFAEVARAIEDEGNSNGYSVILCNSDDSAEKENDYINVLISKQIDGVIFISAGGSREILRKLQISKTPFVVIDRGVPGIHADTVMLENQKGGYLATKHLLDLGHTDIACITGPSQYSPSAQRVDGYCKALTESRISPNQDLIIQGDFRMKSGGEAISQLLDLEKPPTAVFVCNDLMAIGAIQVAHSKGLKIPEDMSIVGFDDISLAQAIYPSLTTIAQPIMQIAEKVMSLLIRRIGDQEEATNNFEIEQVLFEPTLIIRDSTVERKVLDVG